MVLSTPLLESKCPILIHPKAGKPLKQTDLQNLQCSKHFTKKFQFVSFIKGINSGLQGDLPCIPDLASDTS